jgi:hypothetical protein
MTLLNPLNNPEDKDGNMEADNYSTITEVLKVNYVVEKYS